MHINFSSNDSKKNLAHILRENVFFFQRIDFNVIIHSRYPIITIPTGLFSISHKDNYWIKFLNLKPFPLLLFFVLPRKVQIFHTFSKPRWYARLWSFRSINQTSISHLLDDMIVKNTFIIWNIFTQEWWPDPQLVVQSHAALLSLGNSPVFQESL